MAQIMEKTVFKSSEKIVAFTVPRIMETIVFKISEHIVAFTKPQIMVKLVFPFCRPVLSLVCRWCERMREIVRFSSCTSCAVLTCVQLDSRLQPDLCFQPLAENIKGKRFDIDGEKQVTRKEYRRLIFQDGCFECAERAMDTYVYENTNRMIIITEESVCEVQE